MKLSIDTNDSNGADSKYKVFWVEGCGDTEECETVTVTDYVRGADDSHRDGHR